MTAALDVLARESPGITGRDSLLAGRTLPGSILIVRAAAVDPKTPFAVLKQTDLFRIALGENNGQSFYRARLNMKSTEAVAQVKTIAEGFRVSLNKGIDPEALKLIDGLKVAGEGKTLNVTWNAKADDVWAAIEKGVQKMREHMQKRGGMPHKPWRSGTTSSKRRTDRPFANHDLLTIARIRRGFSSPIRGALSGYTARFELVLLAAIASRRVREANRRKMVGYARSRTVGNT